MVRIVCAVLACVALGALPAGALANTGHGSGAVAPSFVARGSAEQAYVTGLRPGERLVLVSRRGRPVQSKRADALGGIVFRGVKPGAGYRVRVPGRGGAESPPFTVISVRPAPPSTRIYDQALPTSGYGYLTTRDGTQLAIDVRLPARQRSLPDPDRVRRLRLRRPGRSRHRHRADRQSARLRGRRRQHARHRLLRRGLQLFRAVAEPRRVRRDRDRRPPAVGPASPRRDDGHLLRGHQPAVRRRHRPAGPGGDRAAVGDRQQRHDAVSGRGAQHRLRFGLGRGPRPRCPAGLSDRR